MAVSRRDRVIDLVSRLGAMTSGEIAQALGENDATAAYACVHNLVRTGRLVLFDVVDGKQRYGITAAGVQSIKADRDWRRRIGVYLLSGQGKRVQEICDMLGYRYNTVLTYLATMKKEGHVEATAAPESDAKRLYRLNAAGSALYSNAPACGPRTIARPPEAPARVQTLPKGRVVMAQKDKIGCLRALISSANTAECHKDVLHHILKDYGAKP